MLAGDALKDQAEIIPRTPLQVETEIEKLSDIMKTITQGNLPHYTIMGCLFQSTHTVF